MAVAGPVLLIARSASVSTWVVAVALLLAGIGSAVGELAMAVFERVVPSGVDGSTTPLMMMTTASPAAIVPSASGLAQVVLGLQLVAGALYVQYLGRSR